MNKSEILELNLTNMDTDGGDTFNFETDLNYNWRKIDSAIGELQSRSSSSGLPPANCRNLRIEKVGLNYQLNWFDSKDTVINDLTLCTWGGTVIVRKVGSYPEDINDGEIVLNNTERNKYSSTPFINTVDNVETEYFFRAFPYSVNGVFNLDKQNVFGEIVYEFIVDLNNSNPSSCIKYAGLNEDYTPAFMDFAKGEFNYGSWKDTFIMSLFRPCMLRTSGVVDYYLNPDDFTMKEDGTPSDVANASYDGNAMIQIGQFWIKTVNENGKAHVHIANKQIDEDYHDFMHYGVDGNFKDYVYRAIYDGCNVSNKIRSLSGKDICKNVAGQTQISYAVANGDGWNVDAYADRVAINYLLMLIGKSLDTQSVFGTGRYTGGSANSNNQIKTGTMDKLGMFWGDNSNGGVKVFGIENWWGNIWKITNGLLQSGGKLYCKMTHGTQDGSSVVGYPQTSVAGMIDTGVTLSGTSGGYISGAKLVSPYGIIPQTVSGSNTTYFCDGCWWNTSLVGFARFGGSPGDGFLVGAFALLVSAAVSYSAWGYGVALSYK